MRRLPCLFLLLLFSAHSAFGMELKKVISGELSSKSVVHSGKGLFFAQNMMYRHTISVYDRNYALVKTISDKVDLARFGHGQYKGLYQGAPVEIAFSHGGRYAWTSNYHMYGPGFNRPGKDVCSRANNYDSSFLYRIDTNNLEIDKVIAVGSVPKYVAATPDNKLVLVSNWCGEDVSVIDTDQCREIRRVPLGLYPRGIVVASDSSKAYVAVMGSYDIAVVNLRDFSVDWIKGVGRAPRHLCIDPAGRSLYATLNGEGQVAKIDLASGKVVKKVATGQAPRSMAISDDGRFLYVVNYNSNTMSKVRTDDLTELEEVKTNHHPIGVTYDGQTKQVWVACYSGTLMVFQD